MMEASEATTRRAGNSLLTRLVRILAFLTIGLAIMAMPARYWWLADLIANLRVQLLLGLTFTLFTTLMIRDVKLAAGLLMALTWQLSWFFSSVAAVPKHPSAKTLKVCTINVLTQNVHYEKIAECISAESPDVVAILELGTRLEQHLIGVLGKQYPHRIMKPDDAGNFGIGLMSRVPLNDATVFYLTDPPVPSIEATLNWNDLTTHLIATHPIPPVTPRFFRARNDHLNLLADRIREIRRHNENDSIVVVGDVNLTPWSPIFSDFVGASGLTEATKGDGTYAFTPTWYQRPGFPFGLVLDHGFVSADLVCLKRTVLADVGSDHRPVMFEIAPMREF